MSDLGVYFTVGQFLGINELLEKKLISPERALESFQRIAREYKNEKAKTKGN